MHHWVGEPNYMGLSPHNWVSSFLLCFLEEASLLRGWRIFLSVGSSSLYWAMLNREVSWGTRLTNVDTEGNREVTLDTFQSPCCWLLCLYTGSLESRTMFWHLQRPEWPHLFHGITFFLWYFWWLLSACANLFTFSTYACRRQAPPDSMKWMSSFPSGTHKNERYKPDFSPVAA